MSKEILPDNLLKESLRKAQELKSSAYEKKIKQEEEHVFSEQYKTKMKKLVDDSSFEQVSNIKPYAVKMSRQQIAKNGIKFYINLYQKYIDLDYQIKSGKISPANALYELIF